MRGQAGRRVRCAIYTRVSTEHGLDQEFNSLEAQRESCEAYVRSQSQEGWRLSPARYDDGGFSGGTMDRPGLPAAPRADPIRADRHCCGLQSGSAHPVSGRLCEARRAF